MMTMEKQPEQLALLLDTLTTVEDQNQRTEVLLDFADRFKEVPEHVARRPFPEEGRIQYCESEAYLWTEELPNGTLKFYFAVENPSGISAKALAYLLDRTLSGAPLHEVAQVSPDIVTTIFRQNISMGKGMGLMSMVQAVRDGARRALKQRH
jgi:cysteine desulfuration protein SufE